MTVSAIVMAAGKGTRMRSDLPKPLHGVCGRPILAWVVDALSGAAPDPIVMPDSAAPNSIVMVVGHGRELVTESLLASFPGRDFVFAEQLTQRGTGDAAAVGLAALDVHDGSYDDDDHVLVLAGDTPLLRAETIAGLVAAHRQSGAAATMITALVDDPTGLGRVVRSSRGDVAAIVEHRDASADQLRINEINASMYCFRRSMLGPALRRITTDNAQGEMYLTDVIEILTESGHTVMPFPADAVEISGVNDRSQLSAAAEVVAARTRHELMKSGVAIVHPSSTMIDATVTIEPNATILGSCQLEGSTHVEAGAVVGPNTRLVNARIGAGAIVESSTIVGVEIGAAEVVGPYEHRSG